MSTDCNQGRNIKLFPELCCSKGLDSSSYSWHHGKNSLVIACAFQTPIVSQVPKHAWGGYPQINYYLYYARWSVHFCAQPSLDLNLCHHPTIIEARKTDRSPCLTFTLCDWLDSPQLGRHGKWPVGCTPSGQGVQCESTKKYAWRPQLLANSEAGP